jgi:O-glycosyl hydrolase
MRAEESSPDRDGPSTAEQIVRRRGWTLTVVFGVCVALGAATGRAQTADVTVDAGKKYQTIEGFGTCLISWDPAMDAFYRTPGAARTYADDLRFTFLRCNLWGDGTIPETADPAEIRHTDPAFAAKDPRTPVFLAFAKAIKEINPGVKVIGTVWSPPAWMKENRSITDRFSAAALGETYRSDKGELTNRVRKEYYPHFVRWLVEMARYYESQGVPLDAISPANEPQFTQTFESCVWTPADLVTIIAMLGAELHKEGLDRVRIFGPESMTGFNWPGGPNRLFVDVLRANPAALEALDVFATHGYEDGFRADVTKNSSAQFWDLIRATGKPCWVTEGGTGDHQWPAPIRERGVGAAIHNSLASGNASAFVPWQYVERRPSEHALMTTQGKTKKTQVVRHYSRFIAPGSRRVEADPAYGAVMASAYLTRAGDGLVLVLIHPQDQEQAVTVTLRDGPKVARFRAIRTSATEDGREIEPVVVREGRTTFAMPGQCIMTLTSERASP